MSHYKLANLAAHIATCVYIKPPCNNNWYSSSFFLRYTHRVWGCVSHNFTGECTSLAIWSSLKDHSGFTFKFDSVQKIWPKAVGTFQVWVHFCGITLYTQWESMCVGGYVTSRSTNSGRCGVETRLFTAFLWSNALDIIWYAVCLSYKP